MTEPGEIVDLDLRWHRDDWKSDPLGWTRRSDGGAEQSTRQDGGQADTRTERSPEPQYQTAADRDAAASSGWDEHCRTCIGLD